VADLAAEQIKLKPATFLFSTSLQILLYKWVVPVAELCKLGDIVSTISPGNLA
jgi:hypothetical protein